MKQTLGILSLLLASIASSQGNTFSVSPFVQWLDTDINADISFGARAGLELPVGRLEFEWASSSLNSEDEVVVEEFAISGTAEGDANFFLLNYRYSHSITDRFGFYGGAGAGGTLVDFEYRSNDGNFSGDGSDFVFTYTFFAGLEFYILPQLSVSGGYKWIHFGDAVLEEQGVEIEVIAGNTNSWELAVNFYF